MTYYNASGIMVGEKWWDTDKANINADGSTINREYRVFSPSQTTPIDENAAVVAIAAATPLLRGSLIRRNIEVKRYNEYGWNAAVTWETFRPRDQDTAGYEEITRISTSGGTAPVSWAINHVKSYDTTGTITDEGKQHGGALNVRKEGGRVVANDPIDIIVRQLEVVVERSFSPGTVDAAYIDTLYNLTGTVNDATFRGYDEGEVLFAGADVTLSNLERETVSYTFILSPNVTGFKVGKYQGVDSAATTITVSKEGHEYMWIEYKSEITGTTPKARVARPIAAHIEQVYNKEDFSVLGL
jgi:hypothetical protein